MKKYYFYLAFTIFFLCGSTAAFSQLVGGSLFLQGAYLEIGQIGNGAFGSCSSPAGYHPNTAGGALGEIYDPGHDGWAIGAPAKMGDYTIPGTPFEGWLLQVNGLRNQAFQGNFALTCPGTFPGTGSLTGSNVSYSNIGGRAIGNWAGTASAGGLQLNTETRVDTFGSAVVVTTKFKNISMAPILDVYIMRTCDPDNDVLWPGGSFATNNTIVHQNEDARHRVLVKGVGLGYPATHDYISLATKDCRAKACIYNAWPLGAGVDLAAIWGGTAMPGGSYYALGQTTLNQDIAIGLVFNVGTIAAGDSAIVSYAYIFDGDAGIDGAFPDPQIVVNGVPKPVVPVPYPNYDTFNVCLYPGMTSLPVNLLYADDKCWSWSKWTWSPGLGLATTTGVTNVINTTVLPPVFTYTITGTDSATGMASCNRKTFYLTILTCNGAVCNSPCEGDTLWFNAPGDSTGATYSWFGPAPSTAIFSTLQHPFIYPATAAHNGLFTVIKNVFGILDTAVTTAVVHHKPNVWASSNAPLCIGGANTLSLTATCDSPGVTYSWTATPPPFTSTLANPVIPGFSTADTGWYTVMVTSTFGCKDTDRTHVTLAVVLPAPIVTVHTPYCQFDAFIPFTVSGLVPGAYPLWYTMATGGVGSTVAPVINTAVVGITTVWFSQIVGSCEGPRDSVKVVVNPVPAPITGITSVCQYFSTSLSDVTPLGVWSSSAPSIATIGATTGIVYGANGGTATMTYTLPTSCYRTTVVNVNPKPAPPVIPATWFCQYKLATPLTATGTSLMWYGLGVTPGYVIAPTPSTAVPGIFNYYVTQTSAFGCLSDSALFPVTIRPEPAPPITQDTTYCQKFQAPALTAIGSGLLWYGSATGMPALASAPVPSTANTGVTTYFVSQTVDACESHRAPLNVTILYLPDFTITARPWICQFDSMSFSYNGPALIDEGYNWQLPDGAWFVGGTSASDKDVVVRFDTSVGIHYVLLTASDYNGRCATTDTIRIKVVPAPDAHMYIQPHACIGDTISLALSNISQGAAAFSWYIDDTLMLNSTAVHMVSMNTNSGGPYVITWHRKGRHILRINGFTTEGCKALPTNDTIEVHEIPDATFKVELSSGKLCVEDSVRFIASTKDYACSYKWEPEHFFNNINVPIIWGRLEQSNSRIKLTVTDPFGCKSTYMQQVNPDACCTLWFPNAFTPGDKDNNNIFHPVFAGYHRFHVFRVSNRWGQTIFESTNNNPCWNGTYNEVPQDMGTYFYYIKYDCGGKTMEQKGDITLVR